MAIKIKPLSQFTQEDYDNLPPEALDRLLSTPEDQLTEYSHLSKDEIDQLMSQNRPFRS